MATALTVTLLRAICSSVLESLLEKKKSEKSINFKYPQVWKFFSTHWFPGSLRLLELYEK